MPIPTLPGIVSTMVQTPKLNTHVLTCGAGTPVLFIHGNGASATFWEETMLALPDGFRSVAVDLRGYGESEALPVDATLGLDDMVADVRALVETMDLGSVHLVAHSMGGGVAMKYAIAYPAEVRTLTLVDSVSPFGYSGTKDVAGTPCYDDGAPAGAGSVNPDFVRLLGEKYRGSEEQMAPLNVIRQFYVKPPFVHPREDVLLESILAMSIGDDNYPGDAVPSANWPTVAPGTRGVVNAFSGKYFNAAAIADIDPQPPVLWIRGDSDLVVGNQAFWDIAALGAMGFVPGWPGADACPPQPMIDQIRAVLDQYAANGGSYVEEVIADAGHSPFLEQPEAFNAIFHAFLQRS